MELCHKNSILENPAIRQLGQFVSEHAKEWDGGVPDLEQYERELHKRMMAIECELLGEELARYDMSVAQIKVADETPPQPASRRLRAISKARVFLNDGFIFYSFLNGCFISSRRFERKTSLNYKNLTALAYGASVGTFSYFVKLKIFLIGKKREVFRWTTPPFHFSLVQPASSTQPQAGCHAPHRRWSRARSRWFAEKGFGWSQIMGLCNQLPARHEKISSRKQLP
jgi:hypothetical protein